MLVSKITTKGQITIPKKVREFLKVTTSDKVEFTLLENGKVLLTSEQNSARELFGMLKHRKQRQPVAVEQMEAAIRKRREQRG